MDCAIKKTGVIHERVDKCGMEDAVNREIVFRGKGLGDEEWTEGGYLFDSDTQSYYILTVSGRGRIVDWKVDSESIGQYTGLKDRGGVKIFEGDIVTIRHGDEFEGAGVVEYFREGFMVKLYKHTIKTKITDLYAQLTSNVPANHLPIVLGNMYDNPELLLKMRV